MNKELYIYMNECIRFPLRDDLSPKVLKALQAMFLAQAQESLYYQRVREGYEK